jgi:hypothetical protein
MDRVALLIQEINEAHQQSADASVILSLVQQLQHLLSQKITPLAASGKRVAVMMPNTISITDANESTHSDIKVAEDQDKVLQVLQVDEKALEDELRQIKEKAAFANLMHGKQTKVTPGFLFDLEEDMAEVPTFIHQPAPQSATVEVVHTDARDTPSVNDQLAVSKKEVVEQLGSAPIKDLKKAIGINDRYVFIQELFRGDETMYERSIKTINNFSNYAEAQYWIERELKVKLSWDNEKSVTQDFYSLVKRRFA